MEPTALLRKLFLLIANVSIFSLNGVASMVTASIVHKIKYMIRFQHNSRYSLPTLPTS